MLAIAMLSPQPFWERWTLAIASAWENKNIKVAITLAILHLFVWNDKERDKGNLILALNFKGFLKHTIIWGMHPVLTIHIDVSIKNNLFTSLSLFY